MIQRLTALMSLVFLLFCGFVFAAELSGQERKIVTEVNLSVDDAIGLIERTANINSGTLNLEGVRQVGDIFRKEFDSLGFETQWVSMPAEIHRAGHLVAEHKGNAGKRLLLIGHLDTVFEKDSPWQPFTRIGMRAKGQGVNDMKGGDVILIYALKALQKVGALDGTQIYVIFTGDEESMGGPREICRKDMIDAAKRSDVALAFESAEGETGTIARRGVSTWLLKVTGVQSHSSDIFTDEVGTGAVFELSRILHQFYEAMHKERYLTFNPAVILGGNDVQYDSDQKRGTVAGKTNIVAKTAVVQGDLRFISDRQLQKARERMRRIVAQNFPHTSAEITFEDGYPAMSPTEGNRKVLALLDKVSRDLGYAKVTALDPGQRGAGDISFVADQLDCLDGLGASGEGGHTPDEDIDLQSIPKLIQRAAILIYRLTR